MEKKPKPKVEPYDEPFNYKPFILPGILLLLVVTGFIFSSFDKEGERYQDLKTNEIQEDARLVELGEEVPSNPYDDLLTFIIYNMNIVILIGVVAIVIRTVLRTVVRY